MDIQVRGNLEPSEWKIALQATLPTAARKYGFSLDVDVPASEPPPGGFRPPRVDAGIGFGKGS